MSVDMDKANETCVGPGSERAGTAASCAGCPNASVCAASAGSGPPPEDPTPALVRDRLRSVKHVILVLSGKGGVGKSTVACQLAFALAARQTRASASANDDSSDAPAVGLLDIDICGPSVPRMLGLQGRGVHRSSSGWSPVYVDGVAGELGVMSVGFMLPEDDKAVIWRGPRKNGLIKQFLTEVDWGDLDYLIVDTPPGTSDEHISIAQYLKPLLASGAKQSDPSDALSGGGGGAPETSPPTTVGCVVVTTPQEIAMQDVRKELNFCEKTGLPVLGALRSVLKTVMKGHFFDHKLGRRANIQRLRILFRVVIPGVLENMAALVAPARRCRFVDTATGDDATAAVLRALPPDLLARLEIHYPVFETGSAAPGEAPLRSPAAAMADRRGARYLGALPLDPDLGAACEAGEYFAHRTPDSPAARPFADAVDAVVEELNKNKTPRNV